MFAPHHAPAMDETKGSTGDATVSLLDGLAVPIFIFGMVMFAGVIALVVLLAPERFPVTMGDKVVRLSELAEQEQALLTEKAMIVSQRNTGKVATPVLDRVVALRGSVVPIGRAVQAVTNAQGGFGSDHGSLIVQLEKLWFSRVEKRMVATGRSRTSDGRSLQVLAAFVDELRRSPVLRHIPEPEYRPIPSPDGFTILPFSLSIILQ